MGTGTSTSSAVRTRSQLIGGQWVAAVGGGWIDVENPARREVIARVPRSGAADVEAAVTAARSALGPWKGLAARDRGAVLLAVADRLGEYAEELARLLAAETGNALRTQARGEVASAADIVRFYGQVASEQKGETLPLDRERRQLGRLEDDRVPHGQRHGDLERRPRTSSTPSSTGWSPGCGP